MNYLSRSVILRLNYMTVKLHGGNFMPPENLLRPQSLEYLVEIVESEVFGQPAYPEIWDKAAVYMHSVISNHVFSDGNKRTGLAGALLFLELNGFKLRPDLVTSDLPINTTLDHKGHLEAFTLLVASAQVNLEQVQAWFAANIIAKK